MQKLFTLRTDFACLNIKSGKRLLRMRGLPGSESKAMRKGKKWNSEQSRVAQ